MQKHFIPHTIEVSVKIDSPWKSLFTEVFTKWLTGWGYNVSSYRDGEYFVFVGIERVR